jgi:uncharacterized damage-inducible protein DinB
MSVYGGKELAAAFRTVRKNTIQIAEDIPENSYDFRGAPDTRSVSQLLVHIAVSPGFQQHMHSSGVRDVTTVNFAPFLEKFTAEEAKPRNKAEIIALLKGDGQKFATFLEGLSDAFLAETISMRPGAEPASRTRFDMLMSVKEHEMHHRGQLMLIERMIGIVPHLTRERQAHMAQRQAATQTK